MKSIRKGFTLVELMVVIVIIGILAALAIPRFLGATNKTKATEFKPVLKQIYTLETAFSQENPSGNFGQLKEISWDIPGRNAAATATVAFFNYSVGNAAIGPAVADQATAYNLPPVAGGIVIAAGNAVATATPNANGVNIRDPNNQPLRNGTDNVCVLTTGEMHVPAAADRISALAGSSVAAGTCP